jgi:single-strand DNA-binding protein
METFFIRCTIWRDAVENVANSLPKDDRVIAHGKLTQKSYETREGREADYVELLVDEVGRASLKWASLKIKETTRNSTSDPQLQKPTVLTSPRSRPLFRLAGPASCGLR